MILTNKSLLLQTSEEKEVFSYKQLHVQFSVRIPSQASWRMTERTYK